MTTPTYYTPELEEFCIGFLYEYKWNSWNGYFEKTDEWIKEEFLGAGGSQLNEETEIDCIEECIKKGTLRVKHLDREDIEGEGWGFDQETKDGQFFYFGQWDDWALILGGRNENPQRVHIYRMNHEQECFCGIINNITEFRKLMKQLGIKKP